MNKDKLIKDIANFKSHQCDWNEKCDGECDTCPIELMEVAAIEAVKNSK